MVANAAYIYIEVHQPVAELTKEAWDRSMTGLAWAPLSLAKAAMHHMPPGGRVIMISSGSSKIAQGDPMVPYAAGKAAMDAVSRNLGAAWGPTYGVTVNSISVGATDTDALQKGIETWGPGFEEMAKEFSLLKRIGSVEEVTNIVAFVASPQASWIIGEPYSHCRLSKAILRSYRQPNSGKWRRPFNAARLTDRKALHRH